MKVAVVGLGYFGRTLVRALHRQGVEVIAIDRSPEAVAGVSDEILHAVALDATDGELLRGQGIDEVDVLVVAIGEEHLASILATAHAIEMGIPRVIARAPSPIQSRILQKIGAHEVFNPEERAAAQLAERLVIPNLIDHIPLEEGWKVVQVRAPSAFVGKSLGELKLRPRHGVTVLAVMPSGEGGGAHLSPGAELMIEEGDQLILLGRVEGLQALPLDEPSE
ncbi:MAG: potassium channel family protein [Planctomycetota bacterium]